MRGSNYSCCLHNEGAFLYRKHLLIVPRGTPYNGLYGEDLPKRGTFFRLQGYIRVAISQVEVYERVGKSVI